MAIAAFLLRALHARFILDSPLFQAPTADEFEHWRLAGKLVAGNWLGEGLGPYFRPQLFAYSLAALRAITGSSIPLIHLLLILMDAATTGILYLAARRVFSRRAALAGALLAAAYGPLIYFSATFNKENFAIHLQAWLLLALAGWTRRRSPSLAAAAGLFAGLGLLCRPALALSWLGMLLLMTAFAVRRGGLVRGVVRGLALAALITLLVLAPAAVRNFTIGGAPVLYSSHGWLNLYFANNGDGAGPMANPPGVGWDLLVERPQIEAGVAPADYAGIDRFWRERFLEYAGRKPAALATGLGNKTLRVVNAQEEALTNPLREMRRRSPILQAAPGTGLLLPLAIAGFVLWRRQQKWRARRETGALLLVFAGLGLAASALVFPATRDRLAPMVVLFLFAGPSVDALFRLRVRRALGIRTALAVLIGVWVLVNWPLPSREHERFEAWMTEINQGDALVQLWEKERQPRQIPEATAAYERALQLRPEGLQPLAQLATAHVLTGKAAAGMEVQRRLVERLRNEHPKNRVVRGRELEKLATAALFAQRSDVALSAAREWREIGGGEAAARLERAALSGDGAVEAGTTERPAR